MANIVKQELLVTKTGAIAVNQPQAFTHHKDDRVRRARLSRGQWLVLRVRRRHLGGVHQDRPGPEARH